MHVFQGYLWKEWREQREILGGLAMGLLVATGLISTLIAKEAVASSFTYTWVITMCAGGALLTVGSDLFARERQRGQLQFLERLPAGLKMAFRGKLAFFVLVMLGAVLYGALLAAIAGLVFTGNIPATNLTRGLIPALALIVVATFWFLAVSTWVPTSIVTAPVSAILIVVSLIPAWLLFRLTGHIMPPMVILVSAALGALLCARVCFVNALAFSRPRRVAVMSCFGLALLSFSPWSAWAWGNYETLWSLPLTIREAVVTGEDGFAFVNLEGMSPPIATRGKWRRRAAIVLDLETLSWSMDGTREASAFADMREAGFPGPQGPIQITLYEPESGGRSVSYDARTGKPGAPHEPAVVSLPFTASDFGIETIGERYRLRWAGTGQYLSAYGEGRDNMVHFRSADGAQHLHLPRSATSWSVLSLEEGFLIRDGRTWSWVDPETQQLEPFPYIHEAERLSATLTSGDLLVFGEGRLIVLDPSSGSREPIDVRGPDGTPVDIIYVESGPWRDRRAPLDSTAPAIVVAQIGEHPESQSLIAILDFESGTLRIPGWGSESLVCKYMALCWREGTQAIAIEDGARLVRYDFDANLREVLVDVADLQD